ncbi:fructose-bisphosphate aldolase-lysine N-methyltransferase, chloroplastic isoform X2 [Asparagus officinalis]|uniref:fructose-bisphosphate aldolase-lysine N-methyltransferase, chloroplastic isoform X1 n=1 Tax=Asparagus officinalis TaxID=4686 RepID=UPI00098E48D4|nr:fructose-bisphosphate aldolase-lysine N-methyltransferase, chloroplastic isoform X1 [Asparagus officinalis]XP_020269604.1 fructose-bisphosphate aldolase-lysine N-methyltransferase, chloroplastic isoform X2 [Asparagus officinalis]
MATNAATKMLTATAASLTHRRPLTCSAARLVPQPPDLMRWVRREGGFVHPSLKIADHTSHGLGLLSTEPIADGSDLIALPDHLPLRFDPQDEPESALGRLAARVPVELWAMRLGLRLLHERSKVGSSWWSYISNLPETFSVPIFFSGEDIKNLQYAPLIHQVNKRCRFLLEFEKEIKSLLEGIASKDHPFEGKDVDASSLGWAMSAVSSRAFRLHGDDSDVPMMLPLIDMCNHSFDPNARIVQEIDTGSSKMLVRVVAEKQIEQDTPITLNYGCLSNDLFLLDYGFVIPENPFDHVELRYDGALLDAASMAAGVSSPSISSPEKWQQEILSQLNLIGDGAVLKVTLGGSDLVDGRLLAALRLLLCNDEDTVLNSDIDALKSLSAEAPLGVPTETAALRTVVALCVVSLEYFPTKIMQDESILKGDASGSTKLAVQFRMQKKLMIIDVMRKLTQRIRTLSKEKSAA